LCKILFSSHFFGTQLLRFRFRDVIWRHYAIISGFPGIHTALVITRRANQRMIEARDGIARMIIIPRYHSAAFSAAASAVTENA